MHSPSYTTAELIKTALHIRAVNRYNQPRSYDAATLVLKQKLEKATDRAAVIAAIRDAGITVY